MAGALLVGSVLGVAGAPAAWPAGEPRCSFAANLLLDPGLSSTPSSGTYETEGGESGRYSCGGPFGSERTGKAALEGRYGTTDTDSCAEGGEGEGTLRLGGGSGDFTFTYSEFSADGVARGEFHGDRFEGTFTLTARDGECALARVTRMRLEGEGTIRP